MIHKARRSSRWPVVFGLLALAAAPGSGLAPWGAAWAQVPAPPSPGTILEGTDIRRPLLPSGPPEVVFSRGDTANTLDRNGRRFQVRGFQFSGNRAISQGQLRRVVERFVDFELNLYDLKKAADAVTAYYRNAGFPVALAIVPAQKVEDGLVVIEVVEGRIGALSFDGARRYTQDMLQAYVRPVTEQPVITIEQLERALLLLNDLPGLTASATLSPGQNRGETDALIKVQESPAHITLQANNNGRAEAGQVRGDVTLELQNPLGLGDQLAFRRMQAERNLLDYRQIKYSVPIASDGVRVAVSESVAAYRVAGDFAALDISGDVTTRELSVTYPFARSRSRNIVGSMGLRETRTRQTALATPLADNLLSLFSAGASANWVHADSSATTASAVLTSNFRDNTASEPGAVLAKMDIDVTHLTGVAPQWDFYFHGAGVLSGSSLPDSEKFSIGGPDSVRGFRAGELRGDRGYLVVGEMRRQFMVGRVVGVFSAFHDFGAVTSLGFASQDILTSAGVGMAIYPSRNSQVRVDVAWPLRNNLSTDPGVEPRVWASASISF